MKRKTYRKIIPVILFAIVVAVIFRSFLFANYIVDGESMKPTLADGDLLMVNKVIYDLVAVDRFDVIVFHANEKEDYVKRVIGLPGDTVTYKDDQLYVNGKYVKEEFLHSYVQASNATPKTRDFNLTGKTGKKKVPEGKLFVMGDNRQNSLDSRSFGFISTKQLVGKVGIKYWPLKHATFGVGK